MDFKTRFQGKISKITKDGTIDDVIMSTEKMAPIGKTSGMGGGYGGIGTGLVTPSEPSTPFESNLDGVSVGFSYQGGLGPSAGTGGGPIVQPSQSTRVVPAAQKPAAPGFKNDLSGPYNSIYDQQNQNQQEIHSQGGGSSSTAIKSQKGAGGEANLMQTPVMIKQKLQGNGQQQIQQYSSITVNKVPASNSISNIDIAKDNIYLKGGSSLADALMSQQRNGNAVQSQTGLSIAMRMKKNREAASGITPGPISAMDKSPVQLQDSPNKPSYLDSLQANSINPPSQLSNNVSQTAQQSVRATQQSVNSQSKPPSGTQQLRQSVERQRSTSFVSISKQIMGGGGPSVKNLDSIRTATNNEAVSLTPGLQRGPQTLEVTLNERLKNNQGNQVKRNNSYAVKTQQPSTIQVGQSNTDLLQKRAMSVANQPTGNPAVEDNNQQQVSPLAKAQKIQNQNDSSSLQVPRRAGAYRSAGIKAQLQEKQSEQKSKLNLNGQSIMNSNPLMSNPYQQQFMNNNNMSPLSPDQLQQQLLMMQQQILLLQQQQSMFSQQVPPNSSPPMLYNKNNSPSKLPINQPGVSNRVSDVYRQIEQADKNFSNQVANQLPYNIPAGSLTGQVGGYGQHGGSPVTDPFVYQQMQQKGIGGIMMDAQSTVSEGGKSGSYKRYTVKDYKQLQQTVQTLKMGGLGANIGSEEWEKAKKKFDAAQEYAKSLRQGQALQATGSLGQSYGAGSGAAANNPNSWSSQQLKRATQEQKLKEKTAREKALEFAKSIPKPKVKPQNYDQQSQSRSVNDNNADMNGIIEEEAFDEYGNTLKGSEFNDLNYRHDNLQGEVDKIKRMFN